MKKIANKYLLLVLLLAFVFCILNVFSFYRNKQLLANKKIAICKIERIGHFPRGPGLWLYYKLIYNHKTIINREQVFIDKRFKSNLENDLLDRNLIIVFDSLNLKNIEIPLKKDDIKKYNIIIPDSLKSIYEKIQKYK